jgi:hypothetical protein
MAKRRFVDRTSTSSLAGNIEFYSRHEWLLLGPQMSSDKHLMIQSPFIDHDDLASKGIGRILCPADTTESEYRKKAWKTSEQWAVLGILRSFEAQCMSLKALTLTLDEEGLFSSRDQFCFSENFRDWNTSYYFTVTMTSIHVGERRPAPPVTPLK